MLLNIISLILFVICMLLNAGQWGALVPVSRGAVILPRLVLFQRYVQAITDGHWYRITMSGWSFHLMKNAVYAWPTNSPGVRRVVCRNFCRLKF